MRITLACLLVLSVPGSTRADNDPPRTVLERAIVAHGGERLERAKLLQRSAKGEISTFGASVPFVADVSWNLPNQCRWAFDLQRNNQKIDVTLTVDGDKGWRTVGGAAKEMTAQELADMQEEVHVNWLATLLPILDPKFELAALPETKVNNEPAVGFKAITRGKPDVKLYFNKKSNLLVKAEHRGKEAGLEVTKEYVFANHKEFSGLKLPTRMTVLSNGKPMADWTITGYKFPEKLDPALFGKP